MGRHCLCKKVWSQHVVREDAGAPAMLYGEPDFTELRALMNKPKILLADEPTGSLDECTSQQIFELLLELVATEGITLIMATHDRGLARRCDRLVEMKDGKVYEPVLS